MLRTLLRMKDPFYIARQEQAPLLREREAFLEHLLQQGTSLAAARSVSWQLLNVIRLLRLTRCAMCGSTKSKRPHNVGHGNSARIPSHIPTNTRDATSSM